MESKQIQTVYVPTDKTTDFYLSNDIGDTGFLNKQSVYIFTPEELNKRDREVAEKAYCNLLPVPGQYDLHKLQNYLNKHYPIL